MFEKQLLILLILLTFVAGDPLTIVQANISDQAVMTCSFSSALLNNTVWYRHKAGSVQELIWNNSYGSFNSSVYNFTVDNSSSSVTLTILGVQQSDFWYLFKCSDVANATFMFIGQLSTSVSVCDVNNSAINIIQSNSTSPITLICDITGINNSTASWYAYSANSIYQLSTGNISTNSSFNNNMYDVSFGSNNYTLQLFNLSIESIFFCSDDSNDIEIFGICFNSSSTTASVSTTRKTTTARVTTTKVSGVSTTSTSRTNMNMTTTTLKANSSNSLKPIISILWLINWLVIFAIILF